MKGKTPSAEQRKYHDLLASRIGCIACHRDTAGHERNHHVSIHHVDGRTKPNAHWFVLPLCAGHHQDGTGDRGLIAVHPWKSRFEQLYGTQHALMTGCALQLIGMGEAIQKTVEALLGLKVAA